MKRLVMDSYSLVDRTKVAQDWHSRGFSCGMWIDHAGREWVCQAHSHEELLMVMSGVIEVAVGEHLLRPSIGEEVHIPAGVPHTIKNVGGKTARWLYGQCRKSTLLPEPFASSLGSTHVTS